MASTAPVSSPGRVLVRPASGSSLRTGLTCSNIGSTAAAEMSAPVTWVTEDISIVRAVLKVRNSLADMTPRVGPASRTNITSVHSGRYTAPSTVMTFWIRPMRCCSSRVRANSRAQAA